MMSHLSKTFATLGLAALGACAPALPAPAAAPAPGAPVRNVIVMVADGAGVAYWTAARWEAGELAVERMPVVALVDTRSASSDVTDSAAGASAFATGLRTFNRALAVDPECRTLLEADTAALRAAPRRCPPQESVFAVARRRGMATGVVTTTYLIDATPAAFVASSPSRYWRGYIAEQFAEADLAVMLGGGRQYFDGTDESATADLLTPLCARSACVGTPAELAGYRADDRRLVGLFAPADMGPAGERSPTLPQMVEAALARLDRDPDGFMAVFETEGTDNAGHANVPLGEIAAEIREFDEAVARVLDFAQRDGRTLVVVTSDHETGGLSMPEGTDPVRAAYTTRGHTGTMVPLFAYGPGAERFGGILDNTDVGRLLREIVAAGR